MLDVGASTGIFSSYFATLGWEVHAFEPCPEVFAKLSTHLTAFATARCHPIAVTDRDGSMRLLVAERADGTVMDVYHTLVPYEPTPDFRWGGSREVTCLTLDSACGELGITTRPGILKIDTAGSEFDVLKGLGRVQPEVIMVEFWEDSHPFGKCPSPPHLMLDFLHGRGYRNFLFITRNGEEELVQLDSQHLRPGDWGNIILLHDSVAPLMGTVASDFVLRSQQRLLALIQMYRTAAAERLEVIHSQHLAALEARRAAEAERLEVAQRRPWLRLRRLLSRPLRNFHQLIRKA
jgi:FkbM family methyltransferase